MIYTEKQIETAKRKYTSFLKLRTTNDYEVSVIGINEAERRCEYHNNIVNAVMGGNKEIEKYWKLFFLNEEVKYDNKLAESKSKLTANKEASIDILAPIKSAKKLVEFGKWLNDAKNKFRKEHFSKKYTAESVSAFLLTI